jgi:hydroxymethylbilane synthase
MPDTERPIIIATRGSALALAQSNAVAAQCRAAFPQLKFEIKIIKTTGDRLQTASLANPDPSLPKGLFTKELEIALLENVADLAVHSLKDLPVDLPDGLVLGAVGKRADVRDVLIYRSTEAARRGAGRGFPANASLTDFPPGTVIATSSTRRRAQLLAARPDLKVVEMRGNVPTRVQKLAGQPELDVIVLAAAGLVRLGYEIQPDGRLTGDGIPDGILAVCLEPEVMLPAVGQGAIGIETRDHDARVEEICARLDDTETHACVLAERAFLRGMGGGCQSPVGAFAEVKESQIRLRAVSFIGRVVRRGEASRPVAEAERLGQELAAKIRG